MTRLLSHSWWMLVLRGIAALVFGVLAVASPGVTLILLIALFAAFTLVTGVAALASAFRGRGEPGWGLVLLLAIVSIAAGVIAIVYPGITALVLVLVIGFNAIFSGLLDIAMAIRIRKEIENEWTLATAGVLSIAFGAIVVIFPGAGALALIWLIALYAILIGALFIVLGFRIRSRGGQPGRPAHGAAV